MIRRILVLTLGLVAWTAPLAYAQTAECSDGSMSYSANFRGTCSHHGGVAIWNDEGMRDEANQWCDENADLCANSHWRGIGGHGNHPHDAGEGGSQGSGMGRNLRQEYLDSGRAGAYGNGMGRNLRQEELERQGQPACDGRFPMDCP